MLQVVSHIFTARWPCQQTLSFGLFAYSDNSKSSSRDKSMNHVGVIHFTPDDHHKVDPPEEYRVIASFRFGGTEIGLVAEHETGRQKLHVDIAVDVDVGNYRS